MKDYETIFTRPDTTVEFPRVSPISEATRLAVQVGSSSTISADLLTLTVIRTFATEADAIAYSQDPEVVAFNQAQAEQLVGSGIQRRITQFA